MRIGIVAYWFNRGQAVVARQMRAALEYRDMLGTLNGDIRGHLTLASGVLADLRPRRPTAVA